MSGYVAMKKNRKKMKDQRELVFFSDGNRVILKLICKKGDCEKKIVEKEQKKSKNVEKYEKNRDFI